MQGSLLTYRQVDVGVVAEDTLSGGVDLQTLLHHVHSLGDVLSELVGCEAVPEEDVVRVQPARR